MKRGTGATKKGKEKGGTLVKRVPEEGRVGEAVMGGWWLGP